MAVEDVNIAYGACPPYVFGILNVTPDSFSDGGKFATVERAVAHAQKMIDAGVDVIDIGGESTRPGAAKVSLSQELDRVLPVIEAVRKVTDVPLSIDSSKPEVIAAALGMGCQWINDVRALRMPGALEVAAASDVQICLMHLDVEPSLAKRDVPPRQNLMPEMIDFFCERIAACAEMGIAKERLVIDPGFGFGKSLKSDLQVLDQLERLSDLELPILLGVSRKSSLGSVLGGAPAHKRKNISLAAAVMAAMKGAHYIRVHDVAETVEALKLVKAIKHYRNET